MWEYLMVLCIVTSFGGAPVNKCYQKISKEKYPKEEICKAAAQAEDYRAYYTLKDNVKGVIVIRTFCDTYKNNGGT
jgi:hypothetical protein